MNELPDRPLYASEFALATALGLIIPGAGLIVCSVALVVAYRAQQWWMVAGLTVAAIWSVLFLIVLISIAG